jgi:two-component system, OmpR family, response regulator
MADLQRILYVEDEPDIQQVAEVALEMVGGFTLNTCSSGEEAMKEALSFKPELFLLDVMMPGMDGPTTLKALRTQPGLADIPVIFMTAKVQPSEVVELKSLGALEVIAKPFDPMALANQIKQIWQQHYDR